MMANEKKKAEPFENREVRKLTNEQLAHITGGKEQFNDSGKQSGGENMTFHAEFDDYPAK